MNVRIRAMALAIALLASLGCQEESSVGPTTSDFTAARNEMTAKLEGRKAPQKPVAPLAPAGVASDPSFGAQGSGYT
jgi:hypothetical protein